MRSEVSIVTPYRNASKYIPRFVYAIQAQTLEDWTCIMVDDGSTDNGPYELQQIVATDLRFKLLTNTNHKTWPGPASARNCALAYINTDLIAFCDIDDIWHPAKLEQQIAYHRSRHLDLSVSAYGRFVDDQIVLPIKSIVCPPPKLSPRAMIGRNPIPMLTVIMSAYLASSGFTQVAHEDFLFWLQLFHCNPSLRYGCLPVVLSYYSINSESLSSQKLSMPMWTYRVFRESGRSRQLSLLFLLFWIRAHICSQLKLLLSTSHSRYNVTELLAKPPLHSAQFGLFSK